MTHTYILVKVELGGTGENISESVEVLIGGGEILTKRENDPRPCEWWEGTWKRKIWN